MTWILPIDLNRLVFLKHGAYKIGLSSQYVINVFMFAFLNTCNNNFNRKLLLFINYVNLKRIYKPLTTLKTPQMYTLIINM